MAELCPVDALTCLGGERKDRGRAKGMEGEQRHRTNMGRRRENTGPGALLHLLVVSPPPGPLSGFTESPHPWVPRSRGGELGCMSESISLSSDSIPLGTRPQSRLWEGRGRGEALIFCCFSL